MQNHEPILPHIILLAQTDTTAGLLCKSAEAINIAKGANRCKALLKEIAYFRHLDTRIPPRFRAFVRYAKKTSFIIHKPKSRQNTRQNQGQNQGQNPQHTSFRVVKDAEHLRFLRGFEWLYSSSANESGKDFDYNFATSKCDVIVKDRRGIFMAKSSRILKINNVRVMKIR